MNRQGRATSVAQLPMPGMPVPAHGSLAANCCTISTGQGVVYLGNVCGGPRYGSHGKVRETLVRKAVVDMGRSGTWHIPYCFLAVAEAA